MQIVLEGVTVRFPDRRAPNSEVIAVDNIWLKVPAGKLVCLLGPSGCGKSTTLFAIAGLQALNEGRIFFGDREVTALDAAKREIGMVFQNYALYPHMTVRQNISFPLQNARWSRERIKERVPEVARIVQIEELLERKPSQLSGGQQQRVAIARAIAKHPKILLMDEPLSNLDAKLRNSTREEIRRIQKETGITTIFVTHDQEEAMSISDEIVIMRTGQLLQQGQPQEVYENPVCQFVATFVGSPAMNILKAEVNRSLHYRGYDLGMVDLPNQEVVLGVRSEDILPADSAEANATVNTAPIPAQVVHAELLGREVLYHLLLDGNDEVKMITDTRQRFAEGSHLQVRFRHGKRYLFAVDGQQTLLRM